MTAIRNGDNDANDATERDAGWTPLNATPMHPEYPSQAAILAGAGSAALTATSLEVSDRMGQAIVKYLVEHNVPTGAFPALGGARGREHRPQHHAAAGGEVLGAGVLDLVVADAAFAGTKTIAVGATRAM